MDYNIDGTIFRGEPVTPEMQQMLEEARMSLLLASSIYSYTMTRVDYLFTYDLPIPTAAAISHDDYRIVAFHPDFFQNGLTCTEERAFVLMHELDHIFFMHHERAIDMMYDHETANEAGDYYVNLHASGRYQKADGTIGDAPRYQKYLKRPSGCLYDENYINLSFDEIYELLDDKKKNKNKSGPSNGSGNGEAMDSFSIGNGGSRSAKLENVQILQAAATFAEQSKNVGENEGDLIHRIREMAKPVVKWEDRFNALLKSSLKTKPTYSRISHLTSVFGGPVFPSYDGLKINVFFGVDSSGSMTDDDYKKATGELSGLLEEYEEWEIHLACCDASVHMMGIYASEDGDTVSDIEFDFKGLGGTLMSPLAKMAAENIENGIEHNAFILVTDGHLFGSDVTDLDIALPQQCTNIVISTSSKSLDLKNAEVIYL